jgi:hypothetical protein
MSAPPPTKEAGAAKRPQNRPADKEVGPTNAQNESLTQSFGRNGHGRDSQMSPDSGILYPNTETRPPKYVGVVRITQPGLFFGLPFNPIQFATRSF